MLVPLSCLFFFFNDTATTEIYTLSLHDALPISFSRPLAPYQSVRVFSSIRAICITGPSPVVIWFFNLPVCRTRSRDRKSTRLNSSHLGISYAVFCLKKKKCRNACNETADGSCQS